MLIYRKTQLTKSKHDKSPGFARGLLGCLVLLVLVMESLALNPNVSIDKYLHLHWSTKDGLPQNTVTCFAQDLQGFIWIGTEKGLARFDGNDFKIFNKNNTTEIKNNDITSLYVSRDGTLWIGTNGGGITVFKDNRFKHFSTRDGLPSQFIRSITGDYSKNIWVSTCGGGVVCLKFKNFKISTTSHLHDRKRFGNCVAPVLLYNKGDLWLGTDRGLIYSQNEKSVTYTVKNGLLDNRVRTISQDHSGNLWVGTPKGVSKIKITNGKVVSVHNPALLANHMVYRILRRRGNLIWVATDRGLYRIHSQDKDKIEKIPGIETLSGNTPVISLFEDRSGMLWIGTHGKGMSCLRNGNFKFYTTADGLSHPYVTSIYQDDKQTIWIGTHGGGLNQFKQGRFKVYTKKDGLSSNYITALCSDHQGNLWVGTPEGLNRLKEQQFNVYTENNGLSGPAISALYIDGKGNPWIGTHSGLKGFKNGKFYVPGNQEGNWEGLANAVVLSIAGDNAGNLWLGTSKGFYRLNSNESPPLLKKISPHLVVWDIYIDIFGSIWLGTNDSGVVRYFKYEGVFLPYPLDSEFSSARIYRIFEDSKRNLWVSSNHGLFVVAKTAFNKYRVRYRSHLSSPDRYYHLLESDGLESAVFSGGFTPAGWQTREGQIWLPTGQGITVIQPEEIKLKDPVIPVLIEKVVVDGQSFAPKSLIFPKSTRKIEFYFTALNFQGFQDLEFKCRLTSLFKGRFGSQEKITHQKSIIFQDIPPSKYNFTVCAGNEDQGWSKTVSYDFTIDYTLAGVELFIFILIIVLPILLVVISKLIERKAKEREMLRIFKDDSRYRTHVLEQKRVKKYMLQLLSIMEEEKPYLDPNMSVTKMAKRLGISKEHISQIINQRFYMNFNQFLNKYRVEEAKERLKDPKESQFVVLKIAHDVGFNSKSTFNTAFKKFTGMSPSQYREKFLGETSLKS